MVVLAARVFAVKNTVSETDNIMVTASKSH